MNSICKCLLFTALLCSSIVAQEETEQKLPTISIHGQTLTFDSLENAEVIGQHGVIVDNHVLGVHLQSNDSKVVQFTGPLALVFRHSSSTPSRYPLRNSRFALLGIAEMSLRTLEISSFTSSAETNLPELSR